MQFKNIILSTLAVAAGVVNAQSSFSNVTTETVTVSSFTTVCPSPTTLTYGKSTYTVTASTTLTIVDCPCTLTRTRPCMATTLMPVYPTGTGAMTTTMSPAPTTTPVVAGAAGLASPLLGLAGAAVIAAFL